MVQIQIDPQDLKKTLESIETALLSFDRQLLYKAMLISEEVIVNLINHANFQTKTPDISLYIQKDENLSLIFKDNAQPFNILTYPDPSFNDNIEKKKLGGLGIYLIKKYAKKVSYHSQNGVNTLKVVL